MQAHYTTNHPGLTSLIYIVIVIVASLSLGPNHARAESEQALKPLGVDGLDSDDERASSDDQPMIEGADLDGSASSAGTPTAMGELGDLDELDSSSAPDDAGEGVDEREEPEPEKSQAEREREAAEASEADEANRQALDEQQAQQREIIMAQAQTEARAVQDQQLALKKQQETLLRHQNAHLADQLEWRRAIEQAGDRRRPQASHNADGARLARPTGRRASVGGNGGEAIHFSDDQPDLSESQSVIRAASSELATPNDEQQGADLDAGASEEEPMLPAAQHHYGSHYGSLQKHHGKYYMFAESHKKGQYKAGFKRGNKKFKISGHSSQHKSHADGHVKWHSKKGKGSHHWDLKHKDKKHHHHHY